MLAVRQRVGTAGACVSCLSSPWPSIRPGSAPRSSSAANLPAPIDQLEIPHLLSLLATNHWNGKVIGLNPLQSQYTSTYGPGYYVPNVFIQYWSMRVMAYTGVAVFLLALWGVWLIRRKTLATSRLFLWVAVWA